MGLRTPHPNWSIEREVGLGGGVSAGVEVRQLSLVYTLVGSGSQQPATRAFHGIAAHRATGGPDRFFLNFHGAGGSLALPYGLEDYRSRGGPPPNEYPIRYFQEFRRAVDFTGQGCVIRATWPGENLELLCFNCSWASLPFVFGSTALGQAWRWASERGAPRPQLIPAYCRITRNFGGQISGATLYEGFFHVRNP
ncbi:MAG: hypothetical protein ACYTEW_21510 [Planctomycetota bacterium]